MVKLPATNKISSNNRSQWKSNNQWSFIEFVLITFFTLAKYFSCAENSIPVEDLVQQVWSLVRSSTAESAWPVWPPESEAESGAGHRCWRGQFWAGQLWPVLWQAPSGWGSSLSSPWKLRWWWWCSSLQWLWAVPWCKLNYRLNSLLLQLL